MPKSVSRSDLKTAGGPDHESGPAALLSGKYWKHISGVENPELEGFTPF